VKVKILYIFLFIFFTIEVVSANGLSLSTFGTFAINKTYDQDMYVDIIIRNEESFSFYNITMEENPYITMSKIPVLTSGENMTITTLVNANEDVVRSFRIYGFYISTLGMQNITHDVDITYEDGVSRCDFSIIKGDKIKWNNLETISTKTIDIVNSETSIVVETIQPNSSWIQHFDTPMTFPFHIVDRTGWPGPDCVLTVLDDSGYINNPELDTIMSVDIDVVFPPTSLELYFLNNRYSMRFYEDREDIFSISNTGDKIAKNIHLSANWFSFTHNDFDLEPGESKNIGYTISPDIYSSNETNKTYFNNLTVTGNFVTVRKEFEIFIEYAEFVDGPINNATTLKDYICANFPEFCEPNIVYQYLDSQDAEFNVSYTERQVKKLYDLLFDNLDSQDIKDKQSIELIDAIKLALSLIENSTNSTDDKIYNLNEKLDVANTVWKLCAWSLSLLIVIVLLSLLILKYKQRHQEDMTSKYG